MNPADTFKDFATTTALVLALTQMVKPFIKSKKLHPIIALLFGLSTCYLLAWLGVEGTLTKQQMGVAVCTGLFAGLTAGGLYDSAHKT